MGIEKHHQRFSLRDLGLLDGPRQKGLDATVELLSAVVNAPKTLIVIFDDMASSLFVRASRGLTGASAYHEIPVEGSLTSLARMDDRTIAIPDLADFGSDPMEVRRFGARAFLAAPIHGPADEAVGALVAIWPEPRDIGDEDKRHIASLAHLASQQIMLTASFCTLRIMAEEKMRRRV